jgi:hypothetical protein
MMILLIPTDPIPDRGRSTARQAEIAKAIRYRIGDAEPPHQERCRERLDWWGGGIWTTGGELVAAGWVRR